MGSLPDKETVVLIFNLFFVGILLLTFIRGFMRGIRKSLFYTIFFTAGAIGLWFGIFALAPQIYQMDLSVFGLESSIQNEIFATLAKEGEFTVETGTYTFEAINAIAICVIQVVLFLVGFVFWWLLYRVIIAIFWFIFGYPFLRVKKVKGPSKENKALAKTIKDKKQKRELLKPTVIKKKKHRLLGGVVGLVNGCAMCLAVSVPIGGIFSIVTSATSSAKLLEEGTIPEEYVEYLEYGDVYDQTWMAKLLDNFGDNGLDNQMFDKLFNIQVDKTDSVKLRKEVTTLAKFAVRASESGILKVDTENLSLEVIKEIDETKLEESFTTLNDLALLDVIYRIGVDFLEHSDYLTKDEQLKNLVIDYDDFRNIKLSHDIANLGKLVCTTIDILQDQEDLENIDYMTLDTEKLNVFVEDLFNVELVNAGINTGLSYVLNLENVVEFVGDHEVNYENINWEEDFVTIIEMYQEFVSIGIDFTSDESISVQLLAENSQHLQNIIDKLYSLDVFNEVKEIAVDFALTELEKNEDIAQYIPEEVFTQLKTNGSETLFTELSTIINLFKDLNEQTTLIKSLDEYLASEDENAKFNIDVDPNLVYILADYIDDSSIAEPIVLNFAELSNDSIKEDMGIDIHKALSEVENLSDELRVVGHVLEGIEAEGGDLNKIISDLSSGDEIQEIDLALIKGIVNEEKAAYQDENDIVHYYVDESKLLKTLMGPMLDNAMNGLLNGEEVFASEDFEWSKEIKILSDLADVLARTTGTEGKLNIAELESTLSNKIHIDVVASLKDNADDSILIEKFAIVALQETIDAETLNKIDSWSNELNAFHKVGSTLTDADGYLVIEDLSNMKVIKMATINAASTVANDSNLIRYFFKQPLTDLGVNVEEITNWNEELSGLASVADTIALEVEGERVLDIEGLETQLEDEIPVATITAARDIFKDAALDKSTVIVRTLLTDALKDTITEPNFFDGWANDNWYNELNALNTIAATMANSNGNLVMSELENLAYIKVETINVASTVANDSNLIRYFFKQPLTDLGVNVEEIDNWNEELSGLASVADTIALEVEGERVLDIEGLETQLENEIPVATLEASRDIFKNAPVTKSTVIVRTLLSDALKDIVQEDGFFDTWTNENWYNELNALNTIAATMANANGNLVMSELENLAYIKVETINAASTVANDSNLIRYFFKQPLTDLGVNVEEIDNWNEELSGLASVADTIALEVEGERVLDIEGLETQLENEIPVATLEASRDIFKDAPVTKSTVIVRTLLADALKDTITEPGFFDNWENDDWHRELVALVDVADTLSTNDKLEVANLSNMDIIYVKTLDSMKKTNVNTSTPNIDSSKILQHMAKQGFTPVIGEDTVALIGTEGNPTWSQEITAIGAMVDGNTYKDSNNEEYIRVSEDVTGVELTIDKILTSEDSNKVKWSVINTSSNYVENSLVLQTILEDPFKSILEEDNLDWDGARWKLEVTAIAEVTYELQDDDGFIAMSLETNKIPVSVLESAKENTLSLVIRKMMSDMLTPMYDANDVSQVPATWDDNRWEGEIEALTEILSTLKDSNNEIDISVSFLDRHVRLEMFDAMEEYINHSTVLQSKIAAEVYTEAGVRLSGTPEVMYGSEEWHNEMIAIDAVLHTVDKDSDGNVSYESLDFDNIKIASLKVARDNIDRSIFIQHKMYISLEGMKLVDDSSLGKQVIYDTVEAKKANSQWYNEVDALIEVAKEYFNVDDSGTIDLRDITFGTGLKTSIVGLLRDNINHSTFLQDKLDMSLFAAYSVKPIVGFTFAANQWNEELVSLYDVVVALFGADSTISNTAINSAFTNGFSIATLEALSKDIHRSLYLQNQLQSKLLAMAPAAYYSSADIEIGLPTAANNYNANWTNDVTALYVAMSKVSTDGTVKFNLSFTDTIDFGLLEVLVDDTNGTPIIGTSKLLQALLKDTIDGLNTLDQTRLDVMSSEFYGFGMNLGYEGTAVAGQSWTVTEQWISELKAIIAVASSQVDSNNQIKLSEVNLDNLNKELLADIIEILDNSYATTYGLPRIIRALLIPALESISTQGVTFDSGYNWASHDEVTSDLQYLYDVFVDLGINNINECNKDNPNISLIKATQVVNEYQDKSVLVKAIFGRIVSELMGSL